MSQKRVTIVLGTRPEAIKLAPVIIRFQKSNLFKTRVILTGQHKELTNEVINLFSIKIDCNLEIMKISQNLEEITNAILNGLTNEFNNFGSDLVIVQGDTTSAFASSLAAFYKKIPIAHVEAGLRTDDLLNPFPEEANRRLISRIASIHFAPTENAKNNLINSGIDQGIEVTGNTVIDTLFLMKDKINNSFLSDLNLNNKKFLLCTFHRRENWGENLESILRGLLKILEKFPDIYALIPMHPNPIVREMILKVMQDINNVVLIEPLRYDHFVNVIKNCFFVITDSGGLQEEAPALGKPVLVARKSTERIEAIEAGTAKLIGTNQDEIFKQINQLIENNKSYELMSNAINPYGDGYASLKIINSIINFLY